MNMPKIELHCHLDGSLRPQTVLELLEAYPKTEKHMRMLLVDGLKENEKLDRVKDSLVAPLDCDSLDTYLKRFDLPIFLMQTEEVLERVTFELMDDCAEEDVKYIEIRFAPQLHMEKGLKYDQIIGSVVRGMKRAESRFDIRGNLILSYMRNSEVQGIYDVIEAGKAFLGDGVVAVDLCAGERDHFAPRFVEAMKYAKSLGYHITIHAGETGISQNVIDAVTLLGAERIGHGVAMMSDQTAAETVKENGVYVECCPTSNVQTKAIKSIKDHPILNFLESGLLVTVNTDNRTVSDTNMSREFHRLSDAFSTDESFHRAVYLNSVNGAFADEDTKAWLISLMA